MENAPRLAVLLVNRRARRGKEWYETAVRELRANGIELAFSRAFKSVRELEGFTSEALEAKIPMIVAGGGDGTFSALSDAVLGKDVVVKVTGMQSVTALHDRRPGSRLRRWVLDRTAAAVVARDALPGAASAGSLLVSCT